MRWLILLLRAVVLVITFAIGVVAAFLGNWWNPAMDSPCEQSVAVVSGGDFGVVSGQTPFSLMANAPVQILSKPKAAYTDEAQTNNIQGHVTLKITFMSDGTVGPIKVLDGLPYGLTENAIEAAKQIKFKPKMVNGQPVNTVLTFEYGFNIY